MSKRPTVRTVPVDAWLLVPAGIEGHQIRSRKIFTPENGEPFRLGGAEVYMIVSESKEFVVYAAYSRTGHYFAEHVLAKSDFERDWERKPEFPKRYRVEKSKYQEGFELIQRGITVDTVVVRYKSRITAQGVADVLNNLVDQEEH